MNDSPCILIDTSKTTVDVTLMSNKQQHYFQFTCYIHLYYSTCLLLAKLLLEDGREVLGNLERLDSNSNGGNSFRRFSIDSVLGNTFLDGNVIRILSKEVRHSVK